jgi:hypothetical protein
LREGTSEVEDVLHDLELGDYTSEIVDKKGYQKFSDLVAAGPSELEELISDVGMKTPQSRRLRERLLEAELAGMKTKAEMRRYAARKKEEDDLEIDLEAVLDIEDEQEQAEALKKQVVQATRERAVEVERAAAIEAKEKEAAEKEAKETQDAVEQECQQGEEKLARASKTKSLPLFDEAIGHFEKAKQLDSTNQRAMGNLGRATTQREAAKRGQATEKATEKARREQQEQFDQEQQPVTVTIRNEELKAKSGKLGLDMKPVRIASSQPP